MTIKQTIDQINSKITHIKQCDNLSAQRVTLLAATKQQPIDIIKQSIDSGIRTFGENRVQEAETKWVDLKQCHTGLTLHLIGPLQTNKVKEAVELFDVIQTLDRVKLADVLVKEMAKVGKQIPCFIQVNTGEEPQKSGVPPKETGNFIAYCQKLGLPIVGLMCIPPADQPPAAHFALLRKIALEHDLQELSMGMSDDYETAVRMGSTCIRLGRALFGERKQP